MPTAHNISWAAHEKAGINITQYKRDVYDMTGVHPTRDQIRQFILSHTESFFGPNVGNTNKEQPAQDYATKEELSGIQESKPSSYPTHPHTTGIIRNPIHVQSGYKRELYPAYELVSPAIGTKPGRVFVEWGASGRKEWVDELDVVRGELPSRRRTKTNRYEPFEDKKRDKILAEDERYFVPIRSDGESDDDSYNTITIAN